jgi:hypothetical protein
MPRQSELPVAPFLLDIQPLRLRRYLPGWILAVAAWLAVPFPLLAQTASAPGSVADLSGIWLLAGGMNEWETRGRRFSPEDPPLEPGALEQFQANRAGLPSGYDGGLDAMDPNTYCFPPGAARSMLMPYPFEIVERPDTVFILFEYGSGIRRIYTDGRPRPEDTSPTWMGYSTGKWDGDALVVETGSLRPETWLDRIGTPHSDALRMTERFRRLNSSALEGEFRFEDPKAFTRAWGGKKLYEPHFEITEYILCEEHLKMGTIRRSK